jgi:hypothetical protein
VKGTVFFSIALLFSALAPVSAQITPGSPQPLNGTYWVGSDSGMYAHIRDAIAAVGTGRSATIILSSGYTDVITSTLNIGPLYGPGIKVVMMPGSTIKEDITDGSAGIKIMEGSALECLGATGSGSVNGQLSTCQVIGTAGGNMASMVTSGAMDMGRDQDVFGLQGVTLQPNGATVTAVGDFEGLVIPSIIANNNFFGGPNVTYLMHIGFGTSGGQMFVNNEVRGSDQVSGALVYITGGEPGFPNPTSPGFLGGEISCRGSGAESIKIDGDPTGTGTVGVLDVIFDRVWNQDCPGATLSAPYISIHNADNVTFRDIDFSTPVSPIISISETAPNLTDYIVFDNVQVICSNPNCEGQTDWISDKTASGYTHKLPPLTIGRQRYGYFTYIAHDTAGNWPQGSTYQGNSGGASTTTDNNLTVVQSETLGSSSYPDASSGYALRVQNQGAINMDFGANDYANSWLESYQNGTTLGKPLNINMKYGGYTNFGGDVFGPKFTFQSGELQNLAVKNTAAVGSSSYRDASTGYAWRVQNQGAINLDFGANQYANSWIESYQNGTGVGKPLSINTRYGGYTYFGGDVFAPSYHLANGYQIPSMPPAHTGQGHAACVLSNGPPILLGRCVTGILPNGFCTCQ